MSSASNVVISAPQICRPLVSSDYEELTGESLLISIATSAFYCITDLEGGIEEGSTHEGGASYSLPHSLSHSLPHSFIHSLTHSLSPSLPHSFGLHTSRACPAHLIIAPCSCFLFYHYMSPSLPHSSSSSHSPSPLCLFSSACSGYCVEGCVYNCTGVYICDSCLLSLITLLTSNCALITTRGGGHPGVTQV